MQLLRLAVLTFQPFLEDYRAISMSCEGADLSVLGSAGKSVLVAAKVDLQDTLKPETDKPLIIPEVSRKSCERAIELVANLVAVSHQCMRTVTSPDPCIALVPQDETLRKALDATSGILWRLGECAIPSGQLAVDISILTKECGDRLDGCALLAEAFSHSHPTGRFHELVRLFERAFASSSQQLVDSLFEFLDKAEGRYTNEEVATWVKGIRDPATHADGRNQSYFALEADVRPVVARMEQAAYDVLLNKRDWHTPSCERRSVWQPTAGTISNSRDIFVTQGKAAKLKFEVLDKFCVYPQNLTVRIHPLPKEWWCKWHGPRSPRIGSRRQDTSC